MECLAGNVAIEMNGHGSDIPPKHTFSFWRDVAKVQVGRTRNYIPASPN